MAKLTKNPDQSNFTLDFFDLVKSDLCNELNKVNDAFWVLSQDVLEYLNDLRGNVVNLKPKEMS